MSSSEQQQSQQRQQPPRPRPPPQQQADQGEQQRIGASTSRAAGTSGRQRVQQQLRDQEPSLDSSDEDAYAPVPRLRRDSSDKDGEADDNAEDDPPPPVPAGMPIVEWGGTREEYLPGIMEVRRSLKGERRDRYTHDARLDNCTAVRCVTPSAGGLD
eukprot:4316959-Pleurochrysis_carterae.AAC.1